MLTAPPDMMDLGLQAGLGGQEEGFTSVLASWVENLTDQSRLVAK